VALSLITVIASAIFATSDPTSTTFKVDAYGDTYVSNAAPNTLYGEAPVIWVSSGGDAQNLGLISFDVTSKFEPGEILVSARIRIFVNTSMGTFPATIVAQRLLAGFDEATTTFSTRPPWAADPATSILFDKRPGPGKTIMVDVTKQLAAWLDTGTNTPFGIQFSVSGASAPVGVAFASGENGYQSGPVLQIYTLPPGHTPYGIGLWQGGVFGIRPE
jgi:hypothetical protein